MAIGGRLCFHASQIRNMKETPTPSLPIMKRMKTQRQPFQPNTLMDKHQNQNYPSLHQVRFHHLLAAIVGCLVSRAGNDSEATLDPSQLKTRVIACWMQHHSSMEVFPVSSGVLSTLQKVVLFSFNLFEVKPNITNRQQTTSPIL